MRVGRDGVIAVLVTAIAFAGIAWLASGIDIPADAPSAKLPWLSPYRVLVSVGFAIASAVHVPHLAGELLAAALLGAVLGAVYAITRLVAKRD
jgi:hypothetical protein